MLNTRAVDFAFRRGAAPLQNGFFTANKQFISWLPVPAELPTGLDSAGARLHDLSARSEAERTGFLEWLASITRVRLRDLSGWTRLAAYAETGVEGVLAVLDANAGRLRIDPRARAERERITTEANASAARVHHLRFELEQLERDVDATVYDAYGITKIQRQRIEVEYG